MIVAVNAVDAADPELDWYRVIGTNTTNEWASSIRSAGDGGYVMAGAKGTATNGLDIYLVKASSDGAVVWERTFTGALDDSALSISEGQDGGFVIVGYTRSYGAGGSDVILIKIDDSGVVEWYKTFGGLYNDRGHAVQKTSDGGYIIAGSTSYSLISTSYDAYLIKTDASGNLIWSRNLGGSDYDSANSVQETSDGGYIIGGETGQIQRDALLLKADSEGYAVWSKAFGGLGFEYAYSVSQTSDGGYILAGTTNSYGSGGDDAYLVKTDSSGGLVWSNYYGGGSSDNARSLLQTADGEYLFVGSTRSYGAGQNDVYLVKVGQSGSMKAMNTFGGLYDDMGYDLVALGDGSCAIVGETKSYSTTFGQDLYLIKTNAFLDDLPPVLSQLTPASGAMVDNPLPSIGASFSDMSGVDTTSVTVSLDSAEITSQCSITAIGFSHSPVSPLAEGIHTVTVGISDVGGNSGVYSWSFTIDTLAPTVSDLTPANRSSTTSTTPTISASFSDAGGVNASGILVRLDLNDITPSTTITQAGMEYVPPSALNQGQHTVTVIVPDLAGNVAIASWVFRVDTTPPTISTLSPGNGTNIMAFGDAQVTISASYSDNVEISVASIRLILDGVDITPWATVTATALSYNGYVSPGPHTVQLIVSDGAGSTSTTSVAFTVTNVLLFLIIAIILIVIIIAAILLLRRRRSKPPPPPKWEQPMPPPPPTKTYMPEPEAEAPLEEVKEVPYKERPPPPPLETKEEVVPAPMPEPVQAVPEQAPVPETRPEPAAAEEVKRTVSCPNCGASNASTSPKCWYCDKPLP